MLLRAFVSPEAPDLPTGVSSGSPRLQLNHGSATCVPPGPPHIYKQATQKSPQPTKQLCKTPHSPLNAKQKQQHFMLASFTCSWQITDIWGLTDETFITKNVILFYRNIWTILSKALSTSADGEQQIQIQIRFLFIQCATAAWIINNHIFKVKWAEHLLSRPELKRNQVHACN